MEKLIQGDINLRDTLFPRSYNLVSRHMVSWKWSKSATYVCLDGIFGVEQMKNILMMLCFMVCFDRLSAEFLFLLKRQWSRF